MFDFSRGGPPAGMNEELDRIFAGRDRNDMQPTLDALSPILDEHPENARVLYEVGGSLRHCGAGGNSGILLRTSSPVRPFR